jgi:GxxExxY protein
VQREQKGESRSAAALPHGRLTALILTAFRSVYASLGYGHTEGIYRRAMARELRDLGCVVVVEATFHVGYKDEIVGTCRVDLLVNDLIVVEIKTASMIVGEHKAQLFSYLKASRRPVGLILNFGPEPGVKRLHAPL